jgi:sugar-specific transcriptional regulator TrmB
MNTDLLVSIGLTESQAKAYLTLVQHGKLTPPVLAAKISETRTNTYKILERLAEMQLVAKDPHENKTTYRIQSPLALEALAREHRNQALAKEKRIKDSLPTLLSYFYTYAEQPGVRFFQGKEEIKEIFNDMLRTRKDVYLLRSPADVTFYDEMFFADFRKKRTKLGIKTHALTPNVASAVHNEDVDHINNFTRSWIPADAYTASVEWDIYGDKVALISYGKEAIGLIIESPQIAESFKQVFRLASMSHSA